MTSTFGTLFDKVFDFGYVDDMLYNIICDADEMIGKVSLGSKIIYDECLKMGMLVDYKIGKTETLIYWRGKNSNKVRLKVQNDMSGKFSFFQF